VASLALSAAGRVAARPVRPARPRAAAAVLATVVVLALLAPWLAPYDAAAQLDVVALKNAAPSAAHPLGTDPFSRDLLSRALYGARTSVGVGLLAAIVGTALGAAWGLAAGSARERTGDALMGAVDVVRALPLAVVLLAVLAVLEAPSPPQLALLIGVAAWPQASRLVYVHVRGLRAREFVAAATALGASRPRVLARHVAPHLLGPLAASGALLLADAMALEAGLSFLGLGVRPPAASWGSMVQDGIPFLASAWWVAAVPSACLVVTVLSAARLADHAHAARLRAP
jgi:peptide/nickel transport system permease protein